MYLAHFLEEQAKKWEMYIAGVIDLMIRNISISTLEVQTLPNYNFSRKTDFGNVHLGGPGKG
jgi:hypothetical protein